MKCGPCGCISGVLYTVLSADERKHQVHCQSQCADSAAYAARDDDDDDMSGWKTNNGRRCQRVDVVRECTSQLRRLMRKKLVTITYLTIDLGSSSY